jgi:hypothetical protein
LHGNAKKTLKLVQLILNAKLKDKAQKKGKAKKQITTDQKAQKPNHYNPMETAPGSN